MISWSTSVSSSSEGAAFLGNPTRRTALELINLTPHLVTIISECGRKLELKAHPNAPRLSVSRTDAVEIVVDGVPVRIGNSTVVEQSIQLPTTCSGTYFVVSRMIAEQFDDRQDLVFPDDLVRDAAGSIVGCRLLSHPSTGSVEI
jgi:hypothetical protein